jgi:hypothetical protein
VKTRAANRLLELGEGRLGEVIDNGSVVLIGVWFSTGGGVHLPLAHVSPNAKDRLLNPATGASRLEARIARLSETQVVHVTRRTGVAADGRGLLSAELNDWCKRIAPGQQERWKAPSI